MIKNYKHSEVPISLSKRLAWTGEDVVRQLRADQNGKCYLCERIRITDFQVEHHKSRDKYPELKFEWSNLYLSCSYCNGKKSSLFNDLVTPTEDNIEEEIRQYLDFPNAQAVFSSEGLSSESIDMTISLLKRIFNGTKQIRNIREQLFYEYAVSKITNFQSIVISWLDNPTDENKNAIIEELDSKAEFLGFKYWIIKSNETLYETFVEYIKWNK